MEPILKKTKVTLASMHLSDDANNAKETKVNDVQNGRCTIDTWKIIRKN